MGCVVVGRLPLPCSVGTSLRAPCGEALILITHFLISGIALACTECEKTFDDSDNLKQHMISHSNIRPFVCQLGLCTKRFKTKAALGSHQKNCSVKCGKILGSSVKIR